MVGPDRLGEVANRLRPKLRALRDESGFELFDLPDAPRPDQHVPAPVRFVAEFENMLLSYADRTRIIAEEHRCCGSPRPGVPHDVVFGQMR